jgi:hypothetical protein
MVTVFDVAGFPVIQLRLEVMIRYTWSLFTGVYVNVAPPEPVAILFRYHWNTGVPPFIGVAVNVTGAPSQTGFCPAEIKTLAGRGALTDIVMVFEVAGLPVLHEIEEVIVT